MGLLEGTHNHYFLVLILVGFIIIILLLPQIPLQNNSSDCGIYVLQFVETLVQVNFPT